MSFRAVARGRDAVAGRSGLLARGSPPPSAFPRSLPQWLDSDESSPLTVARQLRFHTGFPWCPARILARRPPLVGAVQPVVARLARHRHGEVETVRLQGELEVGRGKAGPRSAHHAAVSIAVAQGLEQALQVDLLAARDPLHVARASVVFGIV